MKRTEKFTTADIREDNEPRHFEIRWIISRPATPVNVPAPPPTPVPEEFSSPGPR